ncbi:MAG TPA: DUF732 domain-containing protein [Mycobacterium sp.]
MTKLIAATILTTVPLALAAPTNAAPDADSFEGVCQLLANGDSDYELAVMSVESDTGLSRHDSIRFVNKAIQEHCPAFRSLMWDQAPGAAR